MLFKNKKKGYNESVKENFVKFSSKSDLKTPLIKKGNVFLIFFFLIFKFFFLFFNLLFFYSLFFYFLFFNFLFYLFFYLFINIYINK